MKLHMGVWVKIPGIQVFLSSSKSWSSGFSPFMIWFSVCAKVRIRRWAEARTPTLEVGSSHRAASIAASNLLLLTENWFPPKSIYALTTY